MQRRSFLVASSLGLAGSVLGRPTAAGLPTTTPASERYPPGKPTAKSTILFFLSGGASHVDMWDMKPQAPLEYRGPFQPIATSSREIRLRDIAALGQADASFVPG